MTGYNIRTAYRSGLEFIRLTFIRIRTECRVGVCIGTGKNGISEIIEEMSETGYVKKTAFPDRIGIHGRTGFVFLFSRKWNQNDMAARGSEDNEKKVRKNGGRLV